MSSVGTDFFAEELGTNSFVWAMRFSGFLSILSFVLALFCILYRTPKRFGEYKWFLLNISVMSFIFDVYTSLLYVPLPLFPILYACSLGPLGYLGNEWGAAVPYDLFMILHGATTMAILAAIAYRYASLKGWSRSLRSPIGLAAILVLEFSAALPTVGLRRLAIGDPGDNRQTVISSNEWASGIINSSSCTGVSMEYSPKWTAAFLIATFVSFCLSVPLALWLIWSSFGELRRVASQMSPITRRLHRQLLVALIFQFGVPLCTMIIPFALLCATNHLYLRSKVPQMLVIAGTTHSLGNTTMMVSTIRPFRDALLSAVGKRVNPMTALFGSAASPLSAAIHSRKLFSTIDTNGPTK